MNYKIYVVFHKDIHDKLYDKECLKNLVFVGVNDKIKKHYNPKRGYDSIYEYQLPYYDHSLGEFKETSAIYHIYKNKLYHGLDYVGFAQYDMYIKQPVFQHIDDALMRCPGKIFLFYGNKQPLCQCFADGLENFLLNSYNEYFKASLTFEEFQGSTLISKNFILTSTFIIPVKLFEKIMPWISDLLFSEGIGISYKNSSGGYFNAAEVIERAYGIAFAAEILGGNLQPVQLPMITSYIHNTITNANFFYALWGRILKFTRPLRGSLWLRGYQWRLFKKKISRLLKRQ
jgi:hypothetical protein